MSQQPAQLWALGALQGSSGQAVQQPSSASWASCLPHSLHTATRPSSAIPRPSLTLCLASWPASLLQLSPEEAEARIKAAGEPYKLEILESIRARDPTAPITIYHIGETDHPAHWWDLCAGPHVESTGAIKPDAFELESVAGAYWRGDEKNAMLQVCVLA